MRYGSSLALVLVFTGCFTKRYNHPLQQVWGSKPIYGVDTTLKKITYSLAPLHVTNAGNIYAKGNYLYQVEIGKGIHIINNTVPAMAERIGFISINGCSQISIKGNILYSNNYDDLVMIDITDINSIKEVARTKRAFPTGKNIYPFSMPEDPGYFECPRGDSLVIGWIKDSVAAYCYKN